MCLHGIFTSTKGTGVETKIEGFAYAHRAYHVVYQQLSDLNESLRIP